MSYWNVIDIRRLDRPVDWDAVFGRKAPLILEIGFGGGGHLVHLGKLHPDKNVIGIETSQPSIKKASSKVRNHQLENVRVLDGSGFVLLWLNILNESLHELHINFPDPWPKEGHHIRRLINPQLLELAATKLIPNAKLFIATDHADYQPVVTDCLEATDLFESRLPTTYTTVDNDRFRTKYELKALDEGRVPFYYHWQRNLTPATKQFPLPEDLPMPHAVVQSPLLLSDIADKFEPWRVSAEDNHIQFKALFTAKHNGSLIIETYIKESPHDQRIAFAVTEKEPNQYIVQLHEMGFPRSTKGVHIAVRSFANWMVELSADSKILHHTLQAEP